MDAAGEKLAELPLDERGQAVAMARSGFGEEGFKVLAEHLMEDALLGPATHVRARTPALSSTSDRVLARLHTARSSARAVPARPAQRNSFSPGRLLPGTGQSRPKAVFASGRAFHFTTKLAGDQRISALRGTAGRDSTGRKRVRLVRFYEVA